MSGKNYLAMSDEEFLQLPELVTGAAEEAAPEPVPEVPAEVVAPEVTEEITKVTPAPVAEEPPVSEEPVTEVEKPVVEQTDEEKAAAELAAKEAADKEPKGEDEPPAPEAPDYESFYKRITAPLKANGKTIDIKDAEDAIRLMQMGAGFGRKMQDIQPHLKTLRFMEQNNLLNVDQKELAYLVDLRNKNPAAIKKLVKEAGIDPLDFNNDEEVNYQSNIPEVTDQQVVFREAIQNLVDQDGGRDTLAVFTNTWDVQSHEKLMEDPSLLEVIHEQRQLGIYDRIVSEMDRQKALGKIPQSAPFLAAYKQVGDYLRDTNGFADLAPKQERPAEEKVAPTPKPQLLDTRVAAPKPSVTNNDKAKAAASTKTTPAKTSPIINPLSMSDDEFLAKFGNRF